MRKTLFLAVVLCGCIGIAKAQSPADLAKSPAVQETQQIKADVVKFPKEALFESMTASLAKQGKALDIINADGSIYVIGEATTTRPSNMPGFIQSRNRAYDIAELTAKMELLRLAGEQISSGRGFQMIEDIIDGEDPDAKKKASILQKAATVVDKSLDKALSALGVSDSEIDKMNEAQKRAAYEQNYNRTVRSLVAGMVKGCAVVRIAEGESGGNDYQVAVCLKYSPEFQSFASAIRDGGYGSIPTGAAKSSENTIMTMPESELVKRLGIWITYNEQGQMVVYGFGQQEVRDTGSRASAALERAYDQARLYAVDNIKNFVAEDIVAKELTDDVEKWRQYNDGTEDYFSRSRWELAVKAKETKLNIATKRIRQWKTVHPITQTAVAGCVVVWTADNAQQANALKQQLNSTPRSSATQTQKNESRQQTVRGAITVTGSDDDL